MFTFANFTKEFEKELGKLKDRVEGKIKIYEPKHEDSRMLYYPGMVYPSFTGTYKEKKVHIDMHLEVGAVFLEIYLWSDFDFELTLTKETSGSHISKKLGMDSETELGRSIATKGFDEKFIIKGKLEGRIKDFLSLSHVIHSIEALGDFVKLTIKDNYISTKYFVDSNEDFKAERMFEIIKHFITLASAA